MRALFSSLSFMFACGCASAGGMPSLPPGVTVEVGESTYAVGGRTVEEIGRSLAAASSILRQEHRWFILWGYQTSQSPSGCEIVAVPIEMTSRSTLPSWNAPTNADPELVAMWDAYLTTVEDHHLTHRRLAYETAYNISLRLRRIRTPYCESMGILTRRALEQVLEDFSSQDREFERASQGQISWPPPPPAY